MQNLGAGFATGAQAAPADVVVPLFTDHGRHTGSKPAVAPSAPGARRDRKLGDECTRDVARGPALTHRGLGRMRGS